MEYTVFKISSIVMWSTLLETRDKSIKVAQFESISQNKWLINLYKGLLSAVEDSALQRTLLTAEK